MWCISSATCSLTDHGPAKAIGEVAEDLKATFKVRREKTVKDLAKVFVELYAKLG